MSRPSVPTGLLMRPPSGVEQEKTLKKAKATLLETLTLHGLEEEYYYIIGGEKGPPPKVSETVPMEVCSEAGAAVSQGGGDAPPSCKHISWEEQVWDEEE